MLVTAASNLFIIFADIQPGPQGCLYEGLQFGHGVNFHPPSMVQQFESSTSDITENPYCIECQCDVSFACNCMHACMPWIFQQVLGVLFFY